jgi:hypothetical protein
MIGNHKWASQAAKRLFGWSKPQIELLQGTSEESLVARVSEGDTSVIIKSYNSEEFQRARILAGLRSSSFAKILAESTELRVLALEDLGEQTLGTKLSSASHAERRNLAVKYIQLITAAHEALRTIGIPAKPGVGDSIDAQLGVPRPTTTSVQYNSLVSKLDAISKFSIGKLPSSNIRAAATNADHSTVLWVQQIRENHGQWIIGDTNPHNILVGSDTHEATWHIVDVQLTAGIADVDLAPLGGLQFNLGIEEVWELLSSMRAGTLNYYDWNLLSGWFSITCLCDTLCGLISGSRDANSLDNISYEKAHQSCLSIAYEYISSGNKFGLGWLPYIEWLINTPLTITWQR